MAQTDIRFTFEISSSNSEDSNPPSFSPQFDVTSFKLEEGLNTPFLLEVELISHDAAVDFNTIIDQPALLTIWQSGTPIRYIHGLISDFEQGETGFRRTHYRAIVEPNLARLNLVSDWRIFQQKPVDEILSDIFKANHIEDIDINVHQKHITREYCVQPGFLDFEFIQRLAAEEGFVYRIESSANGHRLLFTDIIHTFGSLTQNKNGTQATTKDDKDNLVVDPVIYNSMPGGDKRQPALRSFNYSQRVRTAFQTQRDYTFKNPRYNQEHREYGKNMTYQSTTYERYDYGGLARYKQDSVGIPFTQTKIQSLRNDAVTAVATGDDARIQPGIAFELKGHAREDLNSYWRPVHIIHKGTQYTSSEEDAAQATQSTYYEQTAQLIPATENWKNHIPQPHKMQGPLIAHVTGPSGEEIFTDEFGRVKVTFPWDRENAPNEHSSCWIRVAQNWAGAGWGHMALPRIGQEVIVDFLDGDQDQPIIIGRTYDATHPTPYKLPALKTQQTLKSKEHKGSGYNELLIDDTTDEIKTQLHTTHEATQLTMGYLTHPRKNDGSAEHRGDGFELRTDSWGALRAGKGLYVSTNIRENAEGTQLDLQEAMTQLEQAISITESLRNAAEVAKAELADLQQQKELLTDTMQELQRAGILINSPEGVAVSSPKVVQNHAGENLFFTSGKQTDISSIKNVTINAGEALSMLAVHDGIKLLAMQGQMNIEAHKDKMNLTSVNDMTIMSTQGKTDVIAKEELTLSCGGSYICLKNGLIELGSAGPLVVRTAGLNLVGTNTLERSGPEFQGAYKEFFILKDEKTDRVLPYARYEITTEDGRTYEGRADKDGKTIAYHTATPQQLSVKILA